ncbi:hypothetical protein BDL97_18G092400 [Sphagnum fallax]|nr:hypothetical protein BDL97_18G092400 [Sphagnum fallax]
MDMVTTSPIALNTVPAAGDQSDLHIIIFDEIDAICKTRGSTRDGTGVHDSIVNQLLTKGTASTSEFQLSDDSKAEDDKDGGRAQVSSVLSSEQAPNVTLCEPNMLKTSVHVLTPDDWVADEKYVDFQEDALSSFQFQIMDIKILASSCANFYLENEKDVATVDMPIEQHGKAQHSSQGHDQIDGVEALNNILLIGMTNRKDLLDEALLRPGRMEVQIEIGLLDEKGRFQILSIHSNKMKENSFLSADVDLKELASKTKNFSGAELEGLVKSTTSFALNRQVSAADLSREIVEDNIKVTMDDFMLALNEVKPAFGAAINTLEMCRLNGMLDCGERHAHIQRTVMTFVEQVSFKVREHLCSLASLKDLVAVVRHHWQQLLELKVVFHSLKLLCFQCFVQSSTMLSMYFNGHFREHRRV